jgi:DNA-binding MarR family transcriptional regulator
MAGKNRPVARTDLRLAGLLKRAQALLLEGYAPALSPHGIDGRELAVLALLDNAGPQSQQEISRRLGVDRTTMVALTDTLEGRGFVRREPHPGDRRKNQVALTAAGRELHREAGPVIDEVEAAFLEPLSAADRAKLLEMLRALTAF